MYILFAFLALISSVGNTIFNRISSNRIGSVLSAAIKSLMITVACFLICLAFGHINIIYSLTKDDWLWIGILGLVTIIDWLFYFLALKRSHLEAFAPFDTAAILFISNLLFSFFMINVVTNGSSTLNMIFYFSGLALLLASMFYIVFNKKLNPVKKIIWVIYSLISATALAFTLVIVKIKLSHIPSDVVAFHQMSIVFVVCVLLLLFSKDREVIKTINIKTYFNFFLSAVFNALLMIFRYKALSYAGANPSLINIIISMDYVFVSIATVLFFKADNKRQLAIMIVLVVSGMVLSIVPALL